jgi:hypothetical protein
MSLLMKLALLNSQRYAGDERLTMSYGKPYSPPPLCPHCNAAMSFNPTSQTLRCLRCNFETSLYSAPQVYQPTYPAAPYPAAPLPGQVPSTVQAIAIMTLMGGCMALLSTIYTVGLAGACCFPIVFIPYNLTVGIMALIKGIMLLNDKTGEQTAPMAVAIMLIVNVISFDIPSLTIGIIILVLLNDPKVKQWYRMG